ncbi:OmpH family outer membrane protein [Aquimarina agarilytica]|uniref:OmpH family outer membrane protein n=1 Tax=Aquimarina agarilytica TaxID=1087449 RepID=UPI0002894A77|nr:OmpH family outer membrane protein [Aquimarina agarilytica]
MKQIKTLLVAVALIFGMSNVANAQSKVAHIASQELVNIMPEYKAAMSELEKLQKTYDAEFKTMATELQNKVKIYTQEEKTKTQEENLKRAQEVQGIEKSVGEYRQKALKDLQTKEVELLKPVIEKARATVQKVARDKGYSYVLDSTTGTGVIMADGYDLMNDVKSALGIQ